MKKYMAALFGALVMVVMQAVPSQALPDGRLSLSVNTSAVFMGTEATFTPSQSVGEASSYNWNYIKYEIYALGNSPFVGTASLTQLNAGTCSGTVGYVTSTTRSCVTAFNGYRTVLSAATTSSSVANVALKFTSMGETSKVFKVRIWLDRNNDDRLNAYEPTSAVSTFHVFDPKFASPFVDFGIDPPVLSTNEFTAWVGAGTIPGAGASSFGLMDPSRLTVEMMHCEISTSCTTRQVIGSWVAHPQLMRYEFKSNTGFNPGLKYYAKLLYKKSDTESVAIANQQLDFSQPLPAMVNTEVTINGQVQPPITRGAPDVPKRQRTTITPTTNSTVNYRAKVLDKDGKPVVGQIVYLAVDVKEVTTATSVYIDDVQLTSRDKDLVFVKRATNSLGQVDARISIRSIQPGDRIQVDAVLNGLRAYEYPGTGSEEVIIWNFDDIRKVSLSLPTTAAIGGANFTVTARVTSGSGVPSNTDRVIFSTEGPLTIANPTSLLTSSGVATAAISWSHLAFGTGSQTIYAYVISDTGISSTSATIYWKSDGAVIQATPTTSVVEAGGVTIDLSGTPLVGKSGTSIVVQGVLRDQAGSPIVTSDLPEGYTFDVGYSGPGYVSGAVPTNTDVNGRFSFKVILGASDSGTGKVLIKFDKDGLSGAYPEILGARSIEIGKVIPVIKLTATKNLLTITFSNSRSKSAEVYLDGVLQPRRVLTLNTQKLTFKRLSGTVLVKVNLNGNNYLLDKIVIP